MDYVQWTGSSSSQTEWEEATYTYDPAGRRIEKDIDGDTTTYVYDGGNVIAEYDDNGDLASKYIHGARVDELVCMIDVADSNAVYYYHYDGLGSVVALSNSSGTSIQSYEYSAYGQVAASDPNFTANPYLFTGRRFDYETGLYYYRARYYNPYIGRFLQTDPMGYGDGMNWYAYCGNNPLSFVDPSGLMQVVTGKYWILPGFHTPDTAMFFNGVRKVVRGMIDQVDEIIPGAPDFGKQVERLEKMATKVGEHVQGHWRAFIQVYDCNDKNNSNTIEDDETIGDSYWIEVTGIGSGGEESPTAYDPTGG